MTSVEPTPVAPSAGDPGSAVEGSVNPDSGDAGAGVVDSAGAGVAGAGSAGAGSGAAGSAAAPPPTTATLNKTPLTKDEGAALQLALRTENAAIWTYALVAANDPGESDTVAGMRAAHLGARDAAASRLIAGGVQPNAPAAAYSTPAVTDVGKARALAVAIETDCTVAWHSLVGNTDRTDLRAFAASALAQAAVRIVQWKMLAKSPKPTTAFPGEQA